jgi:TetR/AcrR family transcriptional regulator, transcriptional repressor for nem operon
MNAAATTDVRQHILKTAQLIMCGKGFSAVGLNEILQAAKVPKGSFYHYFESKEAFGEALLHAYFEDYMVLLEAILTRPGISVADRLMNYWTFWLDTQSNCDPKDKCLAVKLAAEVSDLSEPMRMTLEQGTDSVIARLAKSIEEGMAEGSLPQQPDAQGMAATLYQLWLGASLRAKITRDRAPLESALMATRRLLGLSLAAPN